VTQKFASDNKMMKSSKSLLYSVGLVFSLFLAIPQTFAKTVAPPQDPSQSITYWKPQVISAQQDEAVALAHSVFKVLLRTWDTARVEPDLYVVNSSAGPWAASLADGNILLSRNAIDICIRYGEQHAEHLLAFILGHELAHQRAEDLWHQKFLRLAGSQAPEIQQQLLKDLKINPDTISQLEQREAQADHDGLLIMASVGYDPFHVVDQKDFFTTWVENLWDVSCANQKLDSAITSACKKARSRALRTRTQLTTVATQNSLFELGMQQYVAANYEQAREYFSAFGKDYPSHAVFSNIGLTYLQQAIDIEHQISELNNRQVKFIYPIMLSQSPLATDSASTVAHNKRGAVDILLAQLNEKKHQLIESAITQFEKAIRLQPDHRDSYVLLATSYLVDDNAFMTRGILLGKYAPKFGQDSSAQMLLAITSYKEQQTAAALKKLNTALKSLSQHPDSVISVDSLRYALTYNLAAIAKQQGDIRAAQQAWKMLATNAKQNGNAYLFQLAVSNINQNALPEANKPATTNNNTRLGSKYKASKNSQKVSELWFDGDRYQVIRTVQGTRLVVDENDYLIATSNVPTKTNGQSINIGDAADRPLVFFGLPSRRIHLTSGEYLAYDSLALAIHIVNGRVAGWFAYRNPKP
jgi:tetratricopeptide (TPR) repeat protein